MSEPNSNDPTPPPEGTTTTPPLATDPPPSLIGDKPADTSTWAEYVPDPAKSPEDNAAAKLAHDATKPADPNAETPEAKAAREAALAPVDFTKLKIPEGFAVDDAASKEFTEIVNDDKLSRADRAQKLLDLQSKFITGLAEKRNSAWATVQTDWQSKVQSDPDVGGAKLPAVLTDISSVLDQYGTPELREVFTLTGAGNHPEMVKFLYKIAGKLKEGGPVSGGAPNAPTDAKTLYPNTNLT